MLDKSGMLSLAAETKWLAAEADLLMLLLYLLMERLVPDRWFMLLE